MKTYLALMLFVASLNVLGQEQDNVIDVSFDKSVMLIFGNVNDTGSFIKYKNCGASESIGITKSENKLILQANEEYFPETNLFVELANGDVYDFTLKYNNAPKKTRHNIAIQSVPVSEPAVVEVKTNQQKNNKSSSKEKEPKQAASSVKKIEEPKQVSKEGNSDIMYWAEKVSKEKDYLSRLAVVAPKFIFYVGGIWVNDDKMYFKINLVNESPIAYDIQSRNFFIKRDKSIEMEKVTLLGIYNDSQKRVDGKSIGTYVAVFDKFTIGDKKKFVIQYWEEGGDRNFELKLKSVELLNAKIGL